MKKNLIIAIAISLLAQSLPVTAKTLDNPQLKMIGARQISLGETNPALPGDINGLFINPAVISDFNYMPLSTTTQKLLDEYRYLVVNTSFPFKIPIPLENKTIEQKVGIGLSYGSVTLSDIPQTQQGSDDIIRQIDTYGAGFQIVAGTIATSFYDILNLNSLQVGASAKLYNYYVDNSSRNTYGIDIGAIGTYETPNFPYVEKVTIGGSVLNAFAGKFTEITEDTTSEATLARSFIIGAGAHFMDDTLGVYVNNSIDGLNISSEYTYQDVALFRAGLSTKRLSLGTGLIFDNVAGFGYQDYSLRLDYAYQQNIEPFDGIANHVFSVSILGSSRPRAPQFLEPKENILTAKPYITLTGIAPKYTTVQILNNGVLTRTAQSNRLGKWAYENFPLKEGENKLVIRSYAIEKDQSSDSSPLYVQLDTIPPVLNTSVIPSDDGISIQLDTTDKLSAIKADISGKSLVFQKVPIDFGKEPRLSREVSRWVAKTVLGDSVTAMPIVPQEMYELSVTAEDKAGNITVNKKVPFFIALSYPQDKYVHYKDQIRLIGNTSAMTEKLSIGNQPVYIDAQNQFAFTQKLEPGKNLISLTVTPKKGKQIRYYARILRLVTFDDIQDQRFKGKQEIQFLATLGLLHGDGDNFSPEKYVDRAYLTRVLVNQAKLKLPIVTTSLFPDVPQSSLDAPYIKAAIENGLMFSYPDGTFKPSQPLTKQEIITLLSDANVIGSEEVDDGSQFVTRCELALLLAYNPRYEIQIERLLNWNSGYANK